MKENIHLFKDSLKEELLECKQEETKVRKAAEKYEKLLEELRKNNEKRITAINEIRLQKIAEIDAELEESQAQLETLSEERKKLLYAYCKKNRHQYVLVNVRCLGRIGGKSSFYGYPYRTKKLYKCTVCGGTTSYTGESYGIFKNGPYQRQIPKELYDDVTLREDGKTFRTISSEIEQMEQYILYLQSLSEKICELFGHDATMVGYDRKNFTCKCCKQTLSYQEYIDAHYQAKYPCIVSFHYEPNDYLISLEKGEKLVPVLPTYKVYQKSLKGKK